MVCFGELGTSSFHCHQWHCLGFAPADETLFKCLNKDVAFVTYFIFRMVTPGHCPKMVTQLFLQILFLNGSRPAWYWTRITTSLPKSFCPLTQGTVLGGVLEILVTVFSAAFPNYLGTSWHAANLHGFSSNWSVCYLCQSGSVSVGVAKPVFPVHAVSQDAAAATAYKDPFRRAQGFGSSKDSDCGWWVP